MTSAKYPAEGDGVTERLACCVPHCRRTFRNDRKLTPWPTGSIVMCGKHWRMAPADLRARDRRLRKLLKKIERLHVQPRGGAHGRRVRLWQRVADWHNQNWERARKVIIERAVGIG